MKKILFIIPYFGKFPNYFQLFLNSCKYNSEYNWVIITDNKEEYNYPKNIKIINKSFEEVKEEIQNKFDFKISLKTSYKFCDYRPAYGYIFDYLIEDYQYWGYCDIDLIFGDIGSFLTENLMNRYDKIFINGHMSIYKNTKENNRMFMKKIGNREFYKEYFTNDKNYAFDELWDDSINDIYKLSNLEIYEEKLCADIYPRNANFRLVLGYNRDYLEEFLEKKKKSIFYYKNGKIFRYYKKQGLLLKKEYLYIHLQKRKMIVDLMEENNYLIIPNQFIFWDSEMTIENYEKLSKRRLDLNWIKQYLYGRKQVVLDFLSEVLPIEIKKILKKLRK